MFVRTDRGQRCAERMHSGTRPWACGRTSPRPCGLSLCRSHTFLVWACNYWDLSCASSVRVTGAVTPPGVTRVAALAGWTIGPGQGGHELHAPQGQ